jgi:hypothetical protein
MQRFETGGDQAALGISRVGRRAPVEQALFKVSVRNGKKGGKGKQGHTYPQPLLLAIPSFDLHRIRVIVRHEPAIATHALCHDGPLIQLLLGPLPRQLVILKHHILHLHHLLARAPQLMPRPGDAPKALAIQRDAHEHLLPGDAAGGEIADGRVDGRLLGPHGVELRVVAGAGRLGAEKVVGDQVERVEVLGGGVAEVDVLEGRLNRGEGGGQVAVLGQVDADGSQEGQEIPPLFVVGGIPGNFWPGGS